MEEVEIILEEAVFKVGLVTILDEMVVEIERIVLCNPNFAHSRIISVLIWALYISSTHLHLYKDGKTRRVCFH